MSFITFILEGENLPFDFEGAFREAEGAQRAIFLENDGFKNDTKTPDTGKSLLSPREYS